MQYIIYIYIHACSAGKKKNMHVDMDVSTWHNMFKKLLHYSQQIQCWHPCFFCRWNPGVSHRPGLVRFQYVSLGRSEKISNQKGITGSYMDPAGEIQMFFCELTLERISFDVFWHWYFDIILSLTLGDGIIPWNGQRVWSLPQMRACVVRRADNTATWCKRIGSQSIALLEESAFWLHQSTQIHCHLHLSVLCWKHISSYHYAVCWKVSYACVEKQGKLLSDGSVPSSPPNSQPNEKPHDEIIEQQPHGVLDPKDPQWIWITKKMYGWPLHTFMFFPSNLTVSMINPPIPRIFKNAGVSFQSHPESMDLFAALTSKRQ